MYENFIWTMLAMLIMNVAITYFFKVMLHRKIFKVKRESTRFILIAGSVFVFQSFFLGFLPEYMFSEIIFELGRPWYLSAGMVYLIYFMLQLMLHPGESLVAWLLVFLRRKLLRSQRVIQKDLNALFLGAELEYSHKVGRLLAHAFICFFHGAGMPLLYPLFFIQ